jgi:hypothetical protein
MAKKDEKAKLKEIIEEVKEEGFVKNAASNAYE